MNSLLCEHGIEKLPYLIEENALLFEQNLILLEQRETDLQSLLRPQEKLDAIHTSHGGAGHESSAAQAGGG
jgi:hypothetical protein